MAAEKAMIDSAVKLLETGRYSDLVLELDGRTWNVHRFILCGRSAVFEAACIGSLKEAKTGRIKIRAPTATREAIDHLLSFLYKCDYNDHDDLNDQQNSKADYNAIMIANVHVYGLGDYYCISDLKRAAMAKFEAALPRFSVMGFATVMHEVYNTTRPSDTFCGVISTHAARNGQVLTNDEGFLEDIAQNPDIMKNFSRALVKEYEDVARKDVKALHALNKSRSYQQHCSGCNQAVDVSIGVKQDDVWGKGSAFPLYCTRCNNRIA